MRHPSPLVHARLPLFAAAVLFWGTALSAAEPGGWIPLLDGKSLDHWRAGGQGVLFYNGPAGNHDVRNFELKAEVRAGRSTDAAIFVHTRFQETGQPRKGREIRVGSSQPAAGSLYGVRNIYKSCVRRGEWFPVRILVVANRVCVWIKDHPTVDYLEPARVHGSAEPSGRRISHGTVALRGHGGPRGAAFRNVAIRLLSDSADPGAFQRASTRGYEIDEKVMDRLAGAFIPVIDFHVHLRGGMTVEKALARQAVTGVNVGVLRNLGKGWPIDTDEQLRAFLDSVRGRPLFVGLQVNDRDWFTKHDPALLKRLDYVLADTMIMPMPDDDSKPVKLWMADQYTIGDPEAWMERYIRHNLRVLGEPVTILANPTYLPPAVEDRYDELWTDKRMRRVIEAAVKNHVALEINARSGLPHDRFIRMAKKLGAKFSFGSNNFDDKPIDMKRYLESIERYGLARSDLYVPAPKR